jgi:hypothetical protein
MAAGTTTAVTTSDVITSNWKDHRDERDLPPPPETVNPNSPFQQGKMSINMIVGGPNSSSSRRRYHKDNCEVQLIHTKPSEPLRWSEQPITFSRADHWITS